MDVKGKVDPTLWNDPIKHLPTRLLQTRGPVGHALTCDMKLGAHQCPLATWKGEPFGPSINNTPLPTVNLSGAKSRELS